MSDLAQVEAALVSAITQVIYPTGTANPPLTGQLTNIYRGWPIARNLDADLAAGSVNISVFAQDNEQKVTRFPGEWQALSQPVNSLTATVSGQTVTLGGTVSTPLNAAVSTGGNTYVYAVQANDTLTSIATALAALIDVDTPATSSGPVITIPAASRLSTTAGGVGAMIREIKRQKRGFIISLWCPDPDTRDNLAGPLDDALANIDYLSLPDGSSARLLYEKTRVIDRSENENLYRRDLFYSVEYATTSTQDAYQIVDVVLNLEDFRGDSYSDHDAVLLEGGGYMLMEDGTRLRLDSSLPGLELEGGGYLLTEDGARILLDSRANIHADSIQLEDGTYLLTEGADRFTIDLHPGTSPSGGGMPILMEDGTVIEMEDGTHVLLEAVGGSLLLESGFYLLNEGGGQIAIDSGTPPGGFLLDGGGYLLLENGYKLLLET